MAANATIYKANINIANMDTHYYNEFDLTLAKHPSENDFRLMVRLLAFLFNPNEALLFGEGIAEDDQADLWQKALTGDIDLWIDLGQPDEKRIRKACGKANKVIIYTYQEGPALAWWKQAEKTLKRFKNLSVISLKINGAIQNLAKRSMSLQCNITDGELSLMDNEESITITQDTWKA